MRKALVFGGAFNPPTRAHLTLPLYAMQATGREHVIFVPSKTRYIREDQGKDFAFSDASRLQMLQMLSRTRPWMEVSDYELRAAEQPRTYRTLCALRESGIQGMLLLGSDKLPELENQWMYVKEIANEFGIACMEREGDNVREMISSMPFLRSLGNIVPVPTPESTKHVSSTGIRRSLMEMQELRNQMGQALPEGLTADKLLELMI